VSDYKVGDEILVKYFGRDPVSGHMRLSRKALISTNMAPINLFNEKSSKK
jgi:hypothetical protein